MLGPPGAAHGPACTVIGMIRRTILGMSASSDVSSSLLELLDLRDVPEDDTHPQGEPGSVVTPRRCFEGETRPMPGGHVFGGQVMGQAVVAAGRTVPSGRRVHSMYAYFLSPGDPELPIRFEVDSLRDGGSFSARQVHATQTRPGQGPRTILTATASFQEPQDGLEHQYRAPRAPDPEGLPTLAHTFHGIDHPMARYWATEVPIDIRHVTDPIYLTPDSSATQTQMVWMRVVSPVDVDALVHDAILAFASDYTPFEPVMRRHGLSWIAPQLKMATIDHAIWWHRHVDAHEWLLYVQRSPSASGGRGLTQGHLFARDGSLVATVNQEVMVRTGR
jgi:acyl-CoA thioesterase-2